MTESAAGIGEAIGIFASGRVEQDTRGLESLRAKDDRFGADFLHLVRLAVDESDAGGAVCGTVHIHVSYNRVRDQRAVSRGNGVLDGRERAAEIGESAAAAFAGPAVVARQAAVVRLRDNGCASDGDGAAELRFDALAKLYFAAAHFHGRQKLAVREHLVAFSSAADADIFFDDVVIRSEIGVGNRPIVAIAVAAGGFQIIVAHTVALASPDERAAAENAQALPGKRLPGRRAVGILEIVHEPLVVVFHAGVALFLDGARAGDFRVAIAILEFVRGHVLGEFFGRDGAAGFEEGNFQSS